MGKQRETLAVGQRAGLTWLVVALLAIGCGAQQQDAQAQGPVMASVQRTDATSAPLRFKFRGLDGREISSEAALGRLTVIAFITTYDIASQAQARFLTGIQKEHTPRTNCYALALDRPESTPLVEAFVNTLGLTYPVAHVPQDRLANTSLRIVRSVPSVIVLDRGGHVVWQSQGLVTEDELGSVLRDLD